jgi:hypothetical protein
LRPLPVEEFETGLSLRPLVDCYSRITARQSTYSVPARFIGHRLRALLRADELVVFHGRQVVARHERSTVKGSTTVVLDHYLEILARKPGALPGSTAPAQARKAGVFTAEHEAFWAGARRAHGDATGTRELVEVLLLHRHLSHADVIAGLAGATAVGAVRADVVAVEARRIADTRTNQQSDTLPRIPQRRGQPDPTAPGRPGCGDRRTTTRPAPVAHRDRL